MAKYGDPCSKCGKSEPEVSFYYRKEYGTRRSDCINCFRARGKKWYKENKESNLEYQRQWRQEHKEHLRDYNKQYYLDNRDYVDARNLAWRIKNEDYYREYTKRYYRTKAHKIRARVKAWQKVNNVRTRYYKHRRRQLLRNGNWTPQEWENVKVLFNYTCLACGKREPEIELTFDHVVPLSKGGSNTIDNCQPLCKPCNSGKCDKIIDYRSLCKEVN